MFKRPSGRLLYLYALIAGAVYPIGLAPLSVWPVLFLSVSALLYLCHLANDKQLKWTCYWYGVGFFGVGASWVHVSIHEFGHAPLVLSVFLTVVFVFFLALFKMMIGWLVSFVRIKFGSNGFWLSFPIAWVFLDWVQSIFLTGFPWLYLGYGLVDSLFSGWLKWIGVNGATFVIVFLLSFSGWSLTQWNRNKAGISAALAGVWIAIIAIGSYLAYSKSGTTRVTSELNVALVQPNIPQADKWKRENLLTYLKRYDAMTEPYWNSDLIVWPEAAIPSLKHRVDNWLDMWNEKATRNNSELVLGIPIYDFKKEKIFASMISLGQTNNQYDKQHLVPFGEFVPFENILRGLIEFFNLPMSGMSAGNSEQKAMQLERLNVYPAICYEIAYSDLFKTFIESVDNDNINVIVTISNDAWFGKSWGPYQHFQIARARAIEFGVPVIRSTNTGITAVINHNGKVISQIPQFTQQVLAGKFTFSNVPTIYSKMGAAGFWLVVLILSSIFSGIIFGDTRR
ncbi:apolipoprotein N-acyltransferase [Pleionea sediminis]|uniref:apolipoprotein N-acyltransferase n=1 Tax=Pleionea sediminis TaxID=2569479 RepID=UPI0013DE2992|nr:apolipoprotein N-acyltransferase [Pleionea sediminis]